MNRILEVFQEIYIRKIFKNCQLRKVFKIMGNFYLNLGEIMRNFQGNVNKFCEISAILKTILYKENNIVGIWYLGK